MRVLRDRQDCFCAMKRQSDPPTAQLSLEAVEELWDEWGVHSLVLVSFGLQVILFFASGLRRRSASGTLRLVLWLAYLSADSVAIFVLGHLALHASGPHHQLLFFWAPFVLLHLGGQDTMTAFSMQDNELWRRHLLGLVTQVAATGYVVSRTSWPDRRLLAAMVLMFLSGCFKYVERTLCLYKASPTRFRKSSLDSLSKYAKSVATATETATAGQISDYLLEKRFEEMLNAHGWRNSAQSFEEASPSLIALVSDTPINDIVTVEASQDSVRRLLQRLKSNEDRCRVVYDYVSNQLVLIYDRLYTKALLRFSSIKILTMTRIDKYAFGFGKFCRADLPARLLLLFPFISTSTALVLFKVVEKGKLYSRADVAVSYILLIGAIILEVASLFISILSYVSGRDIFQSAKKQWSEMLGQYNVMRQDAAGIMSFMPHWIRKHPHIKTTRIPISEDLKKFVLDKLLDFGTREQDWNFSSLRGQLALRNWIDSHEDSTYARPGSPLHKSINDVDFPISVLILHIATDILYFQDEGNTNSDKEMKKLSRELSNYIMYLFFECHVMLTSSTELVHNEAHKDMGEIFDRRIIRYEKEAATKVFEYYIQDPRPPASSSSQPTTQRQLLENTSKALISPLLPRACGVAQELIDIHREADCWDLVAAVWVEMLYYIAPRCGGAFHSKHLASGGEFITHVLLLMQLLGPFLPPPGA